MAFSEININEYIIRASQFSFFYGPTQALNKINMNIKRQRVTAVIGPSGCGKSTMLRCINRMNDFVPNTRMSGELYFKKHNVVSSKTDVVRLRREVGMVFQRPNPFPKSIYHNITWGPTINRISCNLEELVEKSLTQAGLWNEVKDRLHSSALALSGGQQQRLCIARAIAMSPEVILMDEPCSALDPKATARVEDLISELREFYTIIIVTHNMQQAARVSDETAFFYEGHLVEMGETKKVFTNPTRKQTEDYITGRFG